MRLCVNSKAMQVKVQREKESCNGTIVTKMEQWKKIVTASSKQREGMGRAHDTHRFTCAIAQVWQILEHIQSAQIKQNSQLEEAGRK